MMDAIASILGPIKSRLSDLGLPNKGHPYPAYEYHTNIRADRQVKW